MRNRHGSYAIYRRILAAGVRSSRGTRIRSFSGECAPHQEPAGEEIGRTGVPMADEAAHLWTAQQLLSSHLVAFQRHDVPVPTQGDNRDSIAISLEKRKTLFMARK